MQKKEDIYTLNVRYILQNSSYNIRQVSSCDSHENIPYINKWLHESIAI